MAYPPEPVEIVGDETKPVAVPATPETPQRVPTGTAIVISNAAGKVLMIKRWGKHGQGTWSVPGGWADPGEDPIESACREALEEVGLEIDPANVDFIGYTHNMYPEGIEDVCLWFRANVWNGEPTICEPEKIKALEWHDWDALPAPLFIGFEGAFAKGIIPLRAG